jgi:hypothetical protein
MPNGTKRSTNRDEERAKTMKINIGAAAASMALLWGGAVLTVGLINLARPRYGKFFLRGVASVYPGYKDKAEPAQVAIGTAYALVDGAACGAIYGWLYNQFAKER